MAHIRIYTEGEIGKLTRKRNFEEKIGQHVQFADADWHKKLKDSSAQFVLVGIPEDIGVRANFGRPGAATAFKPALESLLNQQSNVFLLGDEILVLGEIEVGDLMEAAKDLSVQQPEQLKRLRELVGELDGRVSPVIQMIVEAGKIPLIVGGGHNNAFGNIAGSSRAIGHKINVINCDPHLDFRATEGRHSGNGFSYAWQEGFIDKYAVFSMHEQYNNQASIQFFNEHANNLYFSTYESVFIRSELSYREALMRCIGFVKGNETALELDLDAITNVPSSAKTSSGISPIEARQFVYESALQLKPKYFHIAEGAPVLSHIKADNKTGKLIAYLLCDFIKGFKQAK